MGGHGSSSGYQDGGTSARRRRREAPAKGAGGAKSFAELTEHMKNEHGISLSPSLSNLDFEAVKQGCVGIEDTLNEFPAMKGFVNLVTSDKKTHYYAYAEYMYTTTGLKISKLAMSDWAFGDHEKINKFLQGDVNTKFHPPNTDARSIMAHEFGHAIEAYLARKNAETAYHGFYNMDKHKEATRIIGEAAKIVKKTSAGKDSAGKAKRIATLIGEVSGYAKKDRGEALAECVSDYMTNRENAHPLSKEVWKILKAEVV